MKTAELLQLLRAADVRLVVQGDRLKVSAPPNALTDELRDAIKENKSELIRVLGTPPERVDEGPHRTPDAPRTLSPNQERLWSLVGRTPDSTRFTLPFALELTGALDVERLQAAFMSVVERHEVLRTTVQVAGGQRSVGLRPADNVLQIETAPQDAGEGWVRKRLAEETERLLDVAQGEGIRARLLQLSPDHHVLLIVMHHLVADGASFEVLFSELSAHYASASADSNGLPPLPLQFNDVANWQQEALGGPAARRAEEYWETAYSPPPAPLGLPLTDPDAPAQRNAMRLPPDLVDALESLAQEESTSAFVVALAVYATVLARLSGNQDVVLCIPSSGRDREALHPLIGYFNNVLPLRISVDTEGSFRDAIRTTRSTVLAAQEHESLPFQRIAALPSTRRIPLARAMFNYHGTPLQLPTFPGISAREIDIAAAHSDFDLSCSLLPHQGGLRCTLEHRQGVLATISPERVLEHYLAQLTAATRDPDTHPAQSVADPLSQAASVPQAISAQGHEDEARWTQEPTEIILATDPLELQLTLIWEHALGVRPIRPDDNFFALGGHSLLAVQILDTIEREVGVRLTLGALVEAPTVTALAEAVRAAGWAPAAECLVPMGPDTDGDPLVFVHSFEGHTFIFHELVRQFRGRVSCYGLQAKGLGDDSAPHRTVEEMAGHYTELLENAFGAKRVSIVGMCFGFSVTLAIAKRRLAKGLPTRLIMIDGAWDHLQPDYGADAASLLGWAKGRVRRGLDRTKWAVDTFRRRFTASPYARREAAIRRRTIDAWYAYHPTPYDGAMALIRAEETAKNPEKAWQLAAMKSIARGGLQTVIVPGHHYTLLREPFVSELAEEVLNAAQWESVQETPAG